LGEEAALVEEGAEDVAEGLAEDGAEALVEDYERIHRSISNPTHN